MALAVQSGFTVITDKTQLQASSGGRVLGLFAPEAFACTTSGN